MKNPNQNDYRPNRPRTVTEIINASDVDILYWVELNDLPWFLEWFVQVEFKRRKL